MIGSFRAGHIAGIRLRIHYSWLFVVALLIASLALGWYPRAVPHTSGVLYWLASVVAALALVASVLAHELGHCVVARARGLPVRDITLFIFGGVSNLEREPRRASVEFQVALAGLAVSVLLGIVLLPLGLAIGGAQPLVATSLAYLGMVNLLLALFNLIPGFPLDGGRVFRALLWSATGSLRTATRWTARVGEGIALLFIFAGVLGFFHDNLLAGLWLVLVGWFLYSASLDAGSPQALDMALRGVRVADAMNPAPLTVPVTATLDELVHGYLEPHGLHAAPVVVANELVGMVTLAAVRRIPEVRWDELPTGHVMVPLERIHAVSPDDALCEVFNLMAATDMYQVPVMRGWHLAGTLSRTAIAQFLELRRGLSPAEAERNVTHEIEMLQHVS
ncbi:MAG: site-2 protease family protein [Ktedonobacterales bacterium]